MKKNEGADFVINFKETSGETVSMTVGQLVSEYMLALEYINSMWDVCEHEFGEEKMVELTKKAALLSSISALKESGLDEALIEKFEDETREGLKN